jgi:hypothetical protein
LAAAVARWLVAARHAAALARRIVLHDVDITGEGAGGVAGRAKCRCCARVYLVVAFYSDFSALQNNFI